MSSLGETLMGVVESTEVIHEQLLEAGVNRSVAEMLMVERCAMMALSGMGARATSLAEYLVLAETIHEFCRCYSDLLFARELRGLS